MKGFYGLNRLIFFNEILNKSIYITSLSLKTEFKN